MRMFAPGDLVIVKNAFMWLTYEPSETWQETGPIIILRYSADPSFIHFLSRRGLSLAYEAEIMFGQKAYEESDASRAA